MRGLYVIKQDWALLKEHPHKASIVEFAEKYMDQLLVVMDAAQRTDEICELVNMGDEPMSAIGESQHALTEALQTLNQLGKTK